MSDAASPVRRDVRRPVPEPAEAGEDSRLAGARRLGCAPVAAAVRS